MKKAVLFALFTLVVATFLISVGYHLSKSEAPRRQIPFSLPPIPYQPPPTIESGKHGLDISASRYQERMRYRLQESALNAWAHRPLDPEWQVQDGLWVTMDGREIGEQSGELIAGQGDGSDNNANALLIADDSTDYIFSVFFKLLDRDTSDPYTKFHTNYFGFYLRYQDVNNFVRVDLSEAYRPAGVQYVRLLIREKGTFIPVVNIPAQGVDPEAFFEEWHQLIVSDGGGEVEVYLDGTLLLKTSYTTKVLPGRKGFLANIATRILWRWWQIGARTFSRTL
ncbi:MAG: hypothetical protein ABH845_06900 [Candidatus Omnitrophota bacterium]